MYALANTQNTATIEYIKKCNHNCSDNIDREHPPKNVKKNCRSYKASQQSSNEREYIQIVKEVFLRKEQLHVLCNK